MIKINLKQTFSSLLLGLFISICSTSAVADTGEDLKSVHEMRSITYGILGDYYMFSGLEGDSRYSRQISMGVKRFEKHLNALSVGDITIAGLPELATSITEWQSYKTLLATNQEDFLKQGYANGRLVDDFSKKAISLDKSLKQLYDKLMTSTQYPLSEWTQHTRDMGMIIRTLTTEYAARTTSSLGQVMVIDINEGGITEQTKVFDTLLEKLKKAPQNDPKIYKLMDQVGVKWVFISKSVANYNENAVPFIVNSYGNRISKNLEAIGLHYSSSSYAKK